MINFPKSINTMIECGFTLFPDALKLYSTYQSADDADGEDEKLEREYKIDLLSQRIFGEMLVAFGMIGFASNIHVIFVGGSVLKLIASIYVAVIGHDAYQSTKNFAEFQARMKKKFPQLTLKAKLHWAYLTGADLEEVTQREVENILLKDTLFFKNFA